MIEEIAEMQKQEEIIHNSMFWSYMVLTQQITIDGLFEQDEDFGLIFNPDNMEQADPIELIDVLIEYFIGTEEYEKCQDLVEAKKLYKK